MRRISISSSTSPRILPPETSLFAQNRTDRPLIAMVLAIAVLAPTSIHPPLHPSIALQSCWPADCWRQCLLERLPRVHRTYSGFADCRVSGAQKRKDQGKQRWRNWLHGRMCDGGVNGGLGRLRDYPSRRHHRTMPKNNITCYN